MANCIICDSETRYSFTVDFNKSCIEGRGDKLPVAGENILYHRCPTCDHIHAPLFKEWSNEKFSTHIYNRDYIRVDPDYLGARNEKNVAKLQTMFHGGVKSIKHLDYGSGLGGLELGNSSFYDPYSYDTKLEGKFQLITLYEVLEHCIDPLKLVREVSEHLGEDGIVLMSTALSDGICTEQRTGKDWWYIAPRNGHISIFSWESLKTLWKSVSIQLVILPNGGFLGYRDKIPLWACQKLGY